MDNVTQNFPKKSGRLKIVILDGHLANFNDLQLGSNCHTKQLKDLSIRVGKIKYNFNLIKHKKENNLY